MGNRKDKAINLGALADYDELRPYLSPSQNVKTLDPAKAFAEQVTQENTIYKIIHPFDLGGGEPVTIPSGCTMVFAGGSLNNGTLTGDGTGIIAPKMVIFTGIAISGTWNVPEITSAWFSDAASNNGLKQVFNLANNEIHNVITIEDGTYQVSCLENKIAPINVGSNTDVNLIGNVKLLPNSFDDGWAFNIVYGSKNINIYGGGTIEGDKLEHTGETGQNGHGINIRGCDNVSISNITIKNCWDDCIYIGYKTKPARDIRLVNLELDNGRRQGISITSVENILIDNCRIKNISGTSPQMGIDIEPSPDCVITNVVIRNTIIQNVSGAGIGIRNAKINGLDNVLIENILIDGCNYGIGNRKLNVNGLTIRNVTIMNNNTYGIILKPYERNLDEPYNIRNSSVENVIVDARHDGDDDDVTNFIGGINISVNNCTFNGSTLVRSYLHTDEEHSRGISVLNCTFNAPEGYVQIHNACTVTGGTIVCSNLIMPNGYVSIRDAKIVVDDISASASKDSGSRFNTIEKCRLECSNKIIFRSNCSLIGNYLELCLMDAGDFAVIKSNKITFKDMDESVIRVVNIETGVYCDISNNDISISNKATADNGPDPNDPRKGYPLYLGRNNTFKNNYFIMNQVDAEQEITNQIGAFLRLSDYDEVSYNKFIISGTRRFVRYLFYTSSQRKLNTVIFSNDYDYNPDLVQSTFYATNYSIYNDTTKNRFGASEDRPILTEDETSFEYFDTTLGYPIFWNGTEWVDASGTAVESINA